MQKKQNRCALLLAYEVEARFPKGPPAGFVGRTKARFPKGPPAGIFRRIFSDFFGFFRIFSDFSSGILLARSVGFLRWECGPSGAYFLLLRKNARSRAAFRSKFWGCPQNGGTRLERIKLFL